MQFSILLAIHWRTASDDLRKMCRSVWSFCQQPPSPKPSSQQRRLDEAMNHLREKNYVLASRFLRQVNFVSLVTCPLMNANDLPTCAAQMVAYVCAYTMHTCIANGIVRLSTSGLRRLFVFYYFLGGVTFLLNSDFSVGILLGYKVILCVCYVDSAVHVPANVLLAVMEIGHHFVLSGREFHVLEFAIDRAVFAILASGISVVLERTLRDRLAAQIRNMDSESIILAFRQMLRAVCDGEVLLDDGLCIQEGSNCLNRILFRKESLDKTAFRNILVQDSSELEAFDKFISQPLDAGKTAGQLAAPCLRLSLQSAHAHRVGVDVYHVALQHLFGCEGSYHLLGLKLDVEMQSIPDAACSSTPVLTQPAQSVGSVGRRHLPGQRPRSSRSVTSSLHRTMSNLEEIMILVRNVDQQPVRQIHLKHREPQTFTATSAHEEVPCLRSFVRPTDWETLRRSIATYSDKRGEMDLPGLWVKAFSRQSGFMKARRASLKPCQDVSRSRRNCFWLHLRELQLEEANNWTPSEPDLAEMPCESTV